MKNIKSNKAITLIALVITIVVLIILAGVLINISLGNNGLFTKAKTAKELYTNAQEYEEEQIAKMTNSIEEYVDGNRILNVKLKKQVIKEIVYHAGDNAVDWNNQEYSQKRIWIIKN